MLYSKAMIDLVKEARRRVPNDDKPAIKLANPDVFQELNVIREKSNDIILKAVIKELFFLAGEPWSQLVEQKEKPISSSVEGNYVVKSYRGVTQLLEKKPVSEADRAKSKQRIYRGHLVSE